MSRSDCVNLADNLVGAHGVGWRVPADCGQSVHADGDCCVEAALCFVRISKRDVLGPCGNAIAAESLQGSFEPQRAGETGECWRIGFQPQRIERIEDTGVLILSNFYFDSSSATLILISPVSPVLCGQSATPVTEISSRIVM